MCLSFFWVLLCCHHRPHLTMLQKTCLFLLLLPVSSDFTSGITPFLSPLSVPNDQLLISAKVLSCFLASCLTCVTFNPIYRKTFQNPENILPTCYKTNLNSLIHVLPGGLFYQPTEYLHCMITAVEDNLLLQLLTKTLNKNRTEGKCIIRQMAIILNCRNINSVTLNIN